MTDHRTRWRHNHFTKLNIPCNPKDEKITDGSRQLVLQLETGIKTGNLKFMFAGIPCQETKSIDTSPYGQIISIRKVKRRTPEG